MIGYRYLWPLIRLMPPEMAHAVGLLVLRVPVRFAKRPPDDVFRWRGLEFRNRVGIAAGFDKNAACLAGIERLGAGFVEVGTILVQPWSGNKRPRLLRLSKQLGIWNRLGFPSHGVEQVARNLAAFPRAARRGLIVACNIGPHPGNLKSVRSQAEYIAVARDELLHLAKSLFVHADLFVINLSSPNTPHLRTLLQKEQLCSQLVRPIREQLQQ